MKLLVSGATKTVALHPEVGVLLSPRARNSIESVSRSGRPWAADNDAFLAWDHDRFRKMIATIARVETSRFLWVACPDVVGNAHKTLDRWSEWHPEIDRLGLPCAFVGQDGIEAIAEQIPWDSMHAFFVGGSTEWKLSDAAEALCREAKDRGKWVHVGRVNTLRRVRHAVEIQADSIDGTSFSRWPDRWIPRGLSWIKQEMNQSRLF